MEGENTLRSGQCNGRYGVHLGHKWSIDMTVCDLRYLIDLGRYGKDGRDHSRALKGLTLEHLSLGVSRHSSCPIVVGSILTLWN